MIKIIQNKSVLDDEIIDNSVIITSLNIYKYKEKYIGKNVLVTNKEAFLSKYVNKKLVSNEIKKILMSKAFLNVKDNLKIYNNVDDINFTNILISTYSFYMENELLDNERTNDLKLIYDEYKKLSNDNNLIDEYMLYDLILNEIKNIKYDNIYFENINSLNKYDIKLINELKKYKNVYVYANTINNFSLIEEINKIETIEYEQTNNIDVNNLFKIGSSNLFKNINITSCNDIYEEVKFISNDIKRKINDGLKYKDILIVSPDIKRYENYFSLIFDMPYSKTINKGFLIKSFINLLCDILNGDFTCNKFVSLLKLDIFDIKKEDIDKLDNYIYIWNLENENFYNKFTFNPSGKRELTEKDQENLSYLNKIRENIITSFMYLLENTKDVNNTLENLKYLFMFIDELNITDKLYEKDNEGYNKLINAMELINEYLNDGSISLILNYLSLLLENEEEKKINQDEINILSLDKYVNNDYKIIYFIGLTEKDIPPKFAFSTLINSKDLEDKEIFNLIKKKSDITNNLVSNVLLNENVHITYHKLTDEPSKVEKSKILEKFNNKPESFKYVIKKDETNELNKKINKELIKELYGDELKLSPSSLEVFAKCPYSYFLSYGLKLKIKEKMLFDNREVGTFIHYILENAMKDKITKDSIKENVDNYVKSYLEENNYNFNNIDLYVMDELKNSTYLLIELLLEELENTKLKPEKEELKIKDIPLIIDLDYAILKVTGIVDRLDSYIENNKYYYRIIDYKTGSKQFRLDDVLIGLNMQMLIYLIAIKESIKDKKTIPTAFLYYPALIHYNKENVSVSLDESINNLKESIKANGIISRDILDIYDEENIGNFLDVTSRSKLNDEKVFSCDELECVFKRVKEELKNIGNDILSGNISINPIIDNKNDSCKYCMYNSICKFNSLNDKPRRYKSMKNKEALIKMEER